VTPSTAQAAPSPRSSRISRELPIGAVLIAVGVVIAAVVPDYRAQQWALWAIYGLLALSFTFVWGHAGIFSFGQAAFFGIGGYAFGVTGINLSGRTNETLSALVVAAVVAALFAAALGYFIFYGNVGDVYVAIITLAVTLVLLTVMSSLADPKYRIGDAALGGYNGMVGVPPIMLPTVSGAPLLLGSRGLLAFCVVVAVVVALLLNVLRRRPFGRIVAGVRENEQRTSLLGYDVRRYKLLAFVIAGAVAGLAGGLFAAWAQFINPAVFGLQQAALVAIWVLVGGRESFVGAFLGVALVQGLSSALGGSGGSATPIVLGGVLIAVVLLLPDGIVPTVVRRLRGVLPHMRPVDPAAASEHSDVPQVRDVLGAHGEGRQPQDLHGIELHKHFGGVHALRGVDVSFPARTVQALIGPNGAGKSTCFNLLTGRYRPTSGEVRFGSKDITRLRPDQRARLGLGIKLQVPSYYAPLTARENVWLAAYGRLRDVAAAEARATAVLQWLRMGSRADEPAGDLSHGEHQWLEIGMVVAGDPLVVLLDEPTAGMTREETLRTVELVRAMGEHATVIVVEHDMEFVRELDAPVTMFHEGTVFARGSIEELRADDRVLDVYLGREVVDSNADR
jgi:branched-chain amino acid transport system permease protein